jgi:hypothetical protein
MTDEQWGSTGDSQPEDEGREEREHIFSRKALLQAGWAVPVAMAVAPAAAFAQSGTHVDNGNHTDTVSHTDVSSHSDLAHTDTP